MSDLARRALLDALNGDREKVDPAVNRGLVAIAREVDDLRADISDVKGSIANLQKRVTVVGGSISTAFFTAAAALFSRLI